MKPTLKIDFSTLFVIFTIIIALSNCFLEAQAYIKNTYNKSENDLNFYPMYYFLLPNGNILFRFYRSVDNQCNEPNLHLKILYKNGTLTTFEVENFSVPRLNFCKSPYSLLPDRIIMGFIFKRLYICYYNMSESDPTAPFGMSTLRVNLEGRILRQGKKFFNIDYSLFNQCFDTLLNNSDTWLGPVSYYGNQAMLIGDAIYYTHVVHLNDGDITSWIKFGIKLSSCFGSLLLIFLIFFF